MPLAVADPGFWEGEGASIVPKYKYNCLWLLHCSFNTDTLPKSSSHLSGRRSAVEKQLTALSPCSPAHLVSGRLFTEPEIKIDRAELSHASL